MRFLFRTRPRPVPVTVWGKEWWWGWPWPWPFPLPSTWPSSFFPEREKPCCLSSGEQWAGCTSDASPAPLPLPQSRSSRMQGPRRPGLFNVLHLLHYRSDRSDLDLCNRQLRPRPTLLPRLRPALRLRPTLRPWPKLRPALSLLSPSVQVMKRT